MMKVITHLATCSSSRHLAMYFAPLVLSSRCGTRGCCYLPVAGLLLNILSGFYSTPADYAPHVVVEEASQYDLYGLRDAPKQAMEPSRTETSDLHCKTICLLLLEDHTRHAF
jgi:hypothetical protein